MSRHKDERSFNPACGAGNETKQAEKDISDQQSK